MWLSQTAVRFLADLGIRPGGVVDVEMIDTASSGSDVPDMPNRLALVTPTPGTGEILDGAGEVHGFQLRLRWEPNDPLGAERAARVADRLITRAGYPLMFDDVWVMWISRSGGAPAQLADASGDGERTTYVCTYLATVAEHDWNEET